MRALHAPSPVLSTLAAALALVAPAVGCALDQADDELSLDVDEDFLALDHEHLAADALATPTPAAAKPDGGECLPVAVHCVDNGQTYSSQCEADADGQPAEIELVERGDFGSILDPIDPGAPPFSQHAAYGHDASVDDYGDWDVAPVFTAFTRTIHDRGSLEGELGGEYLVTRGASAWPGNKRFWCQEVALDPGADYHFDLSAVSFKNHGTNLARIEAVLLGEGTELLDTGAMDAQAGWVDHGTSFTYLGSEPTSTLCLREVHYTSPSNVFGVDQISLRKVNCSPVAP